MYNDNSEDIIEKNGDDKKPDRVSVEYTYTNENLPVIKQITKESLPQIDIEVMETSIRLKCTSESGTCNVLDYKILKDAYIKGDLSKAELYDNVKHIIKDNANDKDALNDIVCTILRQFNNHYDHDYGHKKTGDNGQEMLGKIMSVPDGEELDGFVCIEIHEAVMNILHDCGINSVVLSGGSDGANHATLL